MTFDVGSFFKFLSMFAMCVPVRGQSFLGGELNPPRFSPKTPDEVHLEHKL